MKTLKRVWFVILVILNVIVLFIPDIVWWFAKGKSFLNDRLQMLYAKWVLEK